MLDKLLSKIMSPEKAINTVTKQIRKQLKDDTIDEWKIVFNYPKKDLFFQIKEQKYDAAGFKERIEQYLEHRYAEYEKEYNRTITFIIVHKRPADKTLIRTYFITADEKQQYDEELL